MTQNYTDIDQEQLSRWCLDERHLLLCAPITKADENDEVLDFEIFWEKTIENIYGKEIGCGIVDDSKFWRIYRKTEEYYSKSFRKNLGVGNYYQLKRDEASNYADEIMSLIKIDVEKINNNEDYINRCLFVENYLINIKESLSSKSDKIEFKIRNYDDNLYFYTKQKIGFFSIIKKIFFRSRYIFSLKELQQYYINKTFWNANYFADRLISEICNRLECLRNERNVRKQEETEQLKTVDEKIEAFEINRPTLIPQQLNHHNNLIIGLGGTGGRIVGDLRKRMHGDDMNDIKGIGFLHVDCSRELMEQKDNSFYLSEFVDVSLTRELADAIMEHIEMYPRLANIGNCVELLQDYKPEIGTQQNRRLGRIQLQAHYDDFSNAIHRVCHKLIDDSGYSNLNVTIVAGLSGGTGSGSLIDIISCIYKELQVLDIHMNVVGVLPTLPPPTGYDRGRYLANAYAALMELDALNKGGFIPSGIKTGTKHDYSFHKETYSNLFSLLLFKSEKIADALLHLLSLPTSRQTQTFLQMLESQPLSTLGFSKLVHPHEEFDKNFSYDGSAERQVWRELFREADCDLVVEDAEYMRLACVPYSSDERKSFVPALKRMNKIIRNNQDILIDDTSKTIDEISMMSLCYGFQLQSISIVQVLKNQYDQLLFADRKTALSVLHFEDWCADLPQHQKEMKMEGRKGSYILLAMAMEILALYQNLGSWIYQTKGHLPDGTPVKGTFMNHLNWLDPNHNYIFEYEIPTHLWNYIKRDVDESLRNHASDIVWIEKTKERLSRILSSCSSEEIDSYGLNEDYQQAIEILLKNNKDMP